MQATNCGEDKRGDDQALLFGTGMICIAPSCRPAQMSLKLHLMVMNLLSCF